MYFSLLQKFVPITSYFFKSGPFAKSLGQQGTADTVDQSLQSIRLFSSKIPLLLICSSGSPSEPTKLQLMIELRENFCKFFVYSVVGFVNS